MIPQYIEPYFWDIDTEIFEPLKYPKYCIFRILELGDEKAITWLKSIFSDDEIKTIVRNERRLSKKKATHWASVYSIPESEVAAFSYIPPFPFPS